MLQGDAEALLDEIRSYGSIDIVFRDGDSADVQPLNVLPDKPNATLIIWNRDFIPNLKREFVTVSKTPYYRVDEFALPVLEFSGSCLTEWQSRPALTQGRIYGQFAGKPLTFQKWFERITRFVRKRWRKNPVPLLGGYVGPNASEWFDRGGLLLPMFVPPPTPEWWQVMKAQHEPKPSNCR